MLKTLKNIRRRDTDKFMIPHSVQEVIPIRTVWKSGILLVGQNRYSRTWQFSDINYALAGEEDQKSMLLGYSALLNLCDSNADTKLSIVTRKLNRRDFEEYIMIPYENDGRDHYRKEYNDMLLEKASHASGMIRDLYITVTITRKSYKEAESYFARTGSEYTLALSRLGSRCTELDMMDRLRILHGFFRHGEEADFHFDPKLSMKLGHSFKDYICPDSFEFDRDCFRMGDRYGRVLFLKDYAAYLRDDILSELSGIDRPMILSIDVVPIPMDEAIRDGESRLLGVERNIVDFLRKQQQNNNFSGTIPYDMEKQRAEMKEFLDDLTSRDQRMLLGMVTLVHTADSKQQLDADTAYILTSATQRMCQMATLRFQQMDGLNTALPIGVRKIDILRTFTSEALAALMPFRVQEIMEPGGIYYGENAISGNLLLCNRANLLNQSTIITGVPGSGKSFSAKELIVFLALATKDDILICDPEREYYALGQALGGEVIRIAAGSPDHINAMDMVEGYGDGGNPVVDKSEFILSLFEQLVGAGNLSAKEKSILDRCTADVYREYIRSGYQSEVPTLKDLYRQLMLQPEEEARGLALSSELFINGSLNTFAQKTNVDTKNRIIAYDIRELGEQLMPLGMLVTLDSIFNRVIQNWKKGKTTWIFADEFYLLFRYQYSADFFYRLYKRIRKYHGFVTGLTQNVEELLKSDTARLMLANSEFLILLNQATTDRDELASLLNISENQLSYITNVGAGKGLIRCSGNLVPFENSFPKNTKLYRLMTTKLSDMSDNLVN
mgnify:CR=1 FL=1